ncbi:MAG: multiheme c-type cytochrome [Pseudomonadota bacterium]
MQRNILDRLRGDWRAVCAVGTCLLLAGCALLIGLSSGVTPATAALPNDSSHLGVASCAGSTCHGRAEPDGKIVRQDEILRWQDPSSPTGAHSRAYASLSNSRSKAIAARMGIGPATSAQMCLGCHSDPATSRGPKFLLSDGVGCEACHGGSSTWIDVHKAGNHSANLRAGLTATERPAVKAAICLDCHFGSADGNQFVSHQMMAAGHPRVSYELDLFTALQSHHNEDGDYASRKGRVSSVRVWAVGQAMAVERQLSLFSNAKLGTNGAFPEFYFFDCHSCHRQINDDQTFTPTALDNPGRLIAAGDTPFNDENMIMLTAAAKVAAPSLSARFEADSRAFHAALAKDRPAAVVAASRLASSASALAGAFQNANLDRAQTFAIIDMISSDAVSNRFTDYTGSTQAVMAIDTLVSAMVNSGQVSGGAVSGIRSDINRAYAAVRDPNEYRPAEFRRALGSAVRTIRTLR